MMLLDPPRTTQLNTGPSVLNQFALNYGAIGMPYSIGNIHTQVAIDKRKQEQEEVHRGKNPKTATGLL